MFCSHLNTPHPYTLKSIITVENVYLFLPIQIHFGKLFVTSVVHKTSKTTGFKKLVCWSVPQVRLNICTRDI